MTFPRQHWTKLHSTNPIERLIGEIKRRTEVVGIFPNDDAIVRLVGALLVEQNDEWAVQRSRYMTLDTIAALKLTLIRPSGMSRGRLSYTTSWDDPLLRQDAFQRVLQAGQSRELTLRLRWLTDLEDARETTGNLTSDSVRKRR